MGRLGACRWMSGRGGAGEWGGASRRGRATLAGALVVTALALVTVVVWVTGAPALSAVALSPSDAAPLSQATASLSLPLPSLDSQLQPTFDASHNTSLAIKTDGSLWAWAGNDNGQLVDGTVIGRFAPARVGSGTDWVAATRGECAQLLHQLTSG